MIPITSTEQAIEIGKSITAADLGELRREADNLQAKYELALAQARASNDKMEKRAFLEVGLDYANRIQFIHEAIATAEGRRIY